MREVGYLLFGALFTLAAAAGLGRVLLARLKLALEPAEIWMFSLLAGAGLWSLAMFALAATGLVYKGVILAAGVVAIGLGFREGWPRLPRPSPWTALAAPFFVLYLANAMAPEMSPDGSAYHLGLVSRTYREHGFAGHYENMYAHLSQGFEMLFLSAWAFGRNSAAAMVHFAFQCLLPCLMVSYARRFGLVSAGLPAAMLVYFTPVFGIDGISAYIDVAGAAVVFGVFYLTEIFDESPTTGLAVAIGLLAGYAFAVKYTLGLAIPYAMARVAWRARGVKPVAIVAAAALVMAAPWLAKSAVLTGNPLAPFFNAWFPNAFVTPSFESEYRYYMRHYDGLTSYWDIPKEITLGGRVLAGFLGPVWFAAPLALLALRGRRGRSLLLAAAVFAATYATNIGTRFLIPAMPFVALAMGMAPANTRWVPALLLVAHGVTSWPDVNKRYSNSVWRLDRIRWKQALRIESQDVFLHRNFSAYSAARLVEEKVPMGEPVLSFNPEAEAYTTREIRVWFQSANNAMLGDLLHAPLMPEAAPRRRVEFTFPQASLAGIRIVQTVTDAANQWYVHELRLYADGREVPRARDWRVDALVNPWRVREAFDNDAITRWASGQPQRPGQWMEVTLPGVPADRVVMETAEMESTSRFVLETLVRGQWRRVSSAPRVYSVAAPLGQRRLATQAMARHGLRWILVGDLDFGADDYYERRDEWGLELMGMASGRKLYRIRD